MQPHLRRQRLIATALAGLACLLFTMPLQAETEPDPPRLVLGSHIYDAGPVERGDQITHTFTFRNTGGSDLLILSTKAG
jgi:hypothetical protein